MYRKLPQLLKVNLQELNYPQNYRSQKFWEGFKATKHDNNVFVVHLIFEENLKFGQNLCSHDFSTISLILKNKTLIKSYEKLKALFW